MQTFTDTAGQAWNVDINILTVKNVKKYLGIDLLQPKIAMNRIVDPIALCDVLYVICRDQAESLGLSDEDFGRRMGGVALREGRDAFLEAYVNFTPDPKGQTTIRELIEKAKAVSDRMLGVLEKNMGKFDQAIENAVEEFEKDVRKELGKPFLKSQEASE